MVNSPFSCPPPSRPELRQSQSATWGWPRFIDNKHPLAVQAGPSTWSGAPTPIRASSLPIRRAEDSTEFETASQHSVTNSEQSHISISSSSINSDYCKAGLVEDPRVLVVPLQPVEPSPKAKDRSQSGLSRGEEDDCDSERRRCSLSTITDAPSVATSESGANGPNPTDSNVSQHLNLRPQLRAGHDTEAILACVQAMPGGFEPKAGRSPTPEMPSILGSTDDKTTQIPRSISDDVHVVGDVVEAPTSGFNPGPYISPLPEPMSLTQLADSTVGPSAHNVNGDDHALLDHLRGTRNDHTFLNHIRKTSDSAEEKFRVLPIPETSTSGGFKDHAYGEPLHEQGAPDTFIKGLQDIIATAPLVKAKETPPIAETVDSTGPLDSPSVQTRDTVEPPNANISTQDHIEFTSESDDLHRDKPVHAELSVSERIAPDVLSANKAPKANRRRSNANLPLPASVPVPKIVVQQPSETDLGQPESTPNASRLQAMPPAPDDSSEIDAACLPRIKRHALYLRKARNLTVRETVLKVMLGRALGKQTKDSLRTLAQGESL